MRCALNQFGISKTSADGAILDQTKAEMSQRILFTRKIDKMSSV